jgi:hypothetical protein
MEKLIRSADINKLLDLVEMVKKLQLSENFTEALLNQIDRELCRRFEMDAVLPDDIEQYERDYLISQIEEAELNAIFLEERAQSQTNI